MLSSDNEDKDCNAVNSPKLSQKTPKPVDNNIIDNIVLGNVSASIILAVNFGAWLGLNLGKITAYFLFIAFYTAHITLAISVFILANYGLMATIAGGVLSVVGILLCFSVQDYMDYLKEKGQCGKRVLTNAGQCIVDTECLILSWLVVAPIELAGMIVAGLFGAVFSCTSKLIQAPVSLFKHVLRGENAFADFARPGSLPELDLQLPDYHI